MLTLTKTRSLHECFNARVKGKKIYCRMSHPLFIGLVKVTYYDLRLGEPLNCNACQECRDFDCMGELIEEREGDWIY